MFAHLTYAYEIEISVTDTKGTAIKNAVVFLESDKVKQKNNSTIDIEQIKKQFNPLVTVIQTGSSINFPNRDKVKHHVYSFSPAKKFELKLYSGVPSTPVVFDKPGTIVLGCNIHDNMLAFIYVVDTPYYTKTDSSGIAHLTDIPESDYKLKIWHYALQSQEMLVEKDITVKGNINPINVTLDINQSALVPDR